MKFQIKTNKSISDIIRTIGYATTYLQPGKPAFADSSGEASEVSVARKLGVGDYPRFHLYIRQSFGTEPQDKLNTYVFNLHSDQKKPSYKGSHGHSGEYEGKLAEEEMGRIKGELR